MKIGNIIEKGLIKTLNKIVFKVKNYFKIFLTLKFGQKHSLKKFYESKNYRKEFHYF